MSNEGEFVHSHGQNGLECHLSIVERHRTKFEIHIIHLVIMHILSDTSHANQRPLALYVLDKKILSMIFK